MIWKVYFSCQLSWLALLLEVLVDVAQRMLRWRQLTCHQESGEDANGHIAVGRMRMKHHNRSSLALCGSLHGYGLDATNSCISLDGGLRHTCCKQCFCMQCQHSFSGKYSTLILTVILFPRLATIEDRSSRTRLFLCSISTGS